MGWFGRGRTERVDGFLGRLRRDVRGTTLAIMAASLIPLAGFTGCAIDAARLYTVKSRLQQACDAGVLAGRKDMLSSSTGTLDTTDTGPAKTFFYNNFVQAWFGTPKATFSPVANAENNVDGTAYVDVPMTIMKMFAVPTVRVNVTCQAVFDPADTNVMFVLDTTGSMACLPNDDYNSCLNYLGANSGGNLQQNGDGSWSAKEKNGSRIQGVRDAVASFYDALTGNADPTTNFRFGFLPFSATVNVGKLLLAKSYMATDWVYQSRVQVPSAEGDYSSPTSTIDSSKTSAAACSGSTRSPAGDYTFDATSGTATKTSYSWGSGKCTKTVQVLGPMWTYKPRQLPIAAYTNSSSTSTVDNPAQIDSDTSWWAGCVEERGAGLDQDIDTPPSGSKVASDLKLTSYWGPIWSDVEFARQNDNESTAAARTTTMRNLYGGMYEAAVLYEQMPCPLRASPLSAIKLAAGGSKSDTKTAITNYMAASNGYRPFGKTYLDEGMIWGLRLLSPTGLFKDDGAAWPGRVAPKNIMIFLTDGTMETDCFAYSSHGMEGYDKREIAGNCSSSDASSLNSLHETRFSTACQAAVSRKVRIFVILFGKSVSATSAPPLFANCAAGTGGKAYYASDTTTLIAQFKEIAQQVAMLRINK